MSHIPFNWKGPHHGYIGAFIIFLGWTMQPYEYYDSISPYFMMAGCLLLLDDVIEHTVYADTPLRVLFDKVIMPFLEKK